MTEIASKAYWTKNSYSKNGIKITVYEWNGYQVYFHPRLSYCVSIKDGANLTAYLKSIASAKEYAENHSKENADSPKEGTGPLCCGEYMSLAPSEIVWECLTCGHWQYTSS